MDARDVPKGRAPRHARIRSTHSLRFLAPRAGISRAQRRRWLSEGVDEAPERAAGLPQDEAGFTALVREHGDAVFGLALRRVGDRGIAEDLAQETFLRAWRGRAGYRGETTDTGTAWAPASPGPTRVRTRSA